MTDLPLGFALPVSGAWATADAVRTVARRAEELGFHSLWTFQRLLYPAQDEWGPMYRAVHDPLVTLAHAAALTERSRLGVAVLDAPFYPPVLLAKMLASLDVLSDGRLDVGLGLGWADEEFRAVGVARSQRVRRITETVECLRAVWGPDPVEFQGSSFAVHDAVVQPKPLQNPPPILMGGSVEPALRRCGRLADGWISASRQDLRRLGEVVDVIRDAAHEAGRDVDRLRFVVRGVVRLGEGVTGRSGQRRLLTGSEDDVRADLAFLATQGATEVFLDPNFDPEIVGADADAQRSLDAVLSLMERFAPDLPPTAT